MIPAKLRYEVAQFRLARDAYHVGDSPKFNLKG